tara:strand:+ start:222 stop:443 length:222 start_codon:yes stop_codon:yes gene_type:complete
MGDNLIRSVLGFNLKIDIKDEEGNIMPTGVKKTFYPIEITTRINTRLFDKRFFTTFDEALLNKIRDYRNLNEI